MYSICIMYTCEKTVLHDVCTFPRDNKNECRPVVCSTAKPLGLKTLKTEACLFLDLQPLTQAKSWWYVLLPGGRSVVARYRVFMPVASWFCVKSSSSSTQSFPSNVRDKPNSSFNSKIIWCMSSLSNGDNSIAFSNTKFNSLTENKRLATMVRINRCFNFCICALVAGTPFVLVFLLFFPVPPFCFEYGLLFGPAEEGRGGCLTLLCLAATRCGCGVFAISLPLLLPLLLPTFLVGESQAAESFNSSTSTGIFVAEGVRRPFFFLLLFLSDNGVVATVFFLALPSCVFFNPAWVEAKKAAWFEWLIGDNSTSDPLLLLLLNGDLLPSKLLSSLEKLLGPNIVAMLLTRASLFSPPVSSTW